MSLLEKCVVELVKIELENHDFEGAITDAIRYNDDITGLESRVDDLESIDAESTLTEFGDRIDDIKTDLDDRFKALEAALAGNVKAAPVSALDRVLPPTGPESSLVRGYDTLEQLETYARAVIREGRDSTAPMLIAMAFATARNMIDAEVAKDAE